MPRIIEVKKAELGKREGETYLTLAFDIPPDFPLQFSPKNDDEVTELYRQVFGRVMPKLRPILGEISESAEDQVVARSAAQEAARVREYQWGTGLEVIYGKILEHLKSIGCPGIISGAGHEGMSKASLWVSIPVKDAPQATLDLAASLKTAGILNASIEGLRYEERAQLEDVVAETKTQLSGAISHHDFLVKLNQAVFKKTGPDSSIASR